LIHIESKLIWRITNLLYLLSILENNQSTFHFNGLIFYYKTIGYVNYIIEDELRNFREPRKTLFFS